VAGVTPRATGLLLLLLTALGWGSNWPMLKLLLEEMPPLAARSWAGLAAALLFAAGALALRIPLGVPRRLWGRLVLASLLNVTAWMGFATLGLSWLATSEAAILAYTMPVWTVLLAWPVLGERPTGQRVAGLVLGLAGVGVLFAGRGLELGLAKLPGMALMLAAALLFALGSVMAKRFPLPMHPAAAVAWQVGLGCLPLWLLSLAVEEVRWAAISPQGWFFLGWMALVALGLAYLTWFGALARLPASTATLGTLLTPVVGVLGAGLFLGEPLGLREWGALGCTLLGVALAVGDTPPGMRAEGKPR
jgi:drug/metabolite transporter (DMT)-like permease